MTTQTQAPIEVDDEFPVDVPYNGRSLRFYIKRFELDEYTTFVRSFQRVGQMAKKSAVFVEMNRTSDTEADDHVEARLELVGDPDMLAKKAKREADDDAFASKFLIDSITAFVRLGPGQMVRRGKPIETGADVLNTFAARQDVLQALLGYCYTENCLDEETKKKLAALRASEPISTTSTPTADGDAPAPTAGSASGTGSAPAETATAIPIDATSSGQTT